jgi:C1A family cysteine protease
VDAGTCGASWAFAAAGAIEGITKIRTGTLPSVSVQEMLDCSFFYGGAGCSGGYLDSGLLYVQHKGGVTASSAYPYTGTNGPCSAAGLTNVASFNSIQYIDYESDIALFNAVVQQPVAISIATGNTAFQFYDGGVLDGTNACLGDVTDGALVVGYGHDSSVNKDYFKIKYSFGTTWGEGGYIRIWRNDQVNDYTGICGIYSTPLVPLKGI